MMQTQDFTLASERAQSKVAPTAVHSRLVRLVDTLAATSVAGCAVALLEAIAWARPPEGDDTSSFARVMVLELGLTAPIAAAVGVAVYVGGMLALPRGDELFSMLARRWRRATDSQKRRASATVSAALPATIIWMSLAAQWSRFALASCPRPADAGALMVIGTIALGAVMGTFTLAAGFAGWTVLEERGARDRVQLKVVAAGASLAFLLFVWGIASGTNSGAGGLFGIWGVLKRPELDLRAPILLAITAGAGLLLPLWLARCRWFVAVGLMLAPFPFAAHAALHMQSQAPETALIERAPPLGRMALKVLRHATDRDRDGASALFGGGDCDDRDPRVGPGALDVPGNHIDEDCSGEDAPVVADAGRKGQTRSKVAAARIPNDLNILLITVDTLRADLGYAGYPKPVSPNIDALAARSVVFERSYALASYTGKSVGPLLSGKYPSETHRGWGHFNRYPRDDTMVAERFQSAGIHTFGAHAHWYFTPPYGLARGFDTWDTSAVPRGAGHDEDATVTGDKLTEVALRMLGNAEHTKSRFFAWFHYFDPHSEYARHRDAPDLGSGQRALYDGEVWFTDKQIGRILDFVRNQPWAARTAIVLTSDHGEAFSEHYMIRHGVEIWEELVRVPLMFYVPGIPARRVPQRRSAIDIVPTLLDLMHVMWPTGEGPFDFISGRSLLDDMLPADGVPAEQRDILIDMPAGPNNDERRAFIQGDLKLYVSNGVRSQLFDLAADPSEKRDLSGDKPRVSAMMAKYRGFKAGLHEVYVKPLPKDD